MTPTATDQELKAALTAHINSHSIAAVLVALAEIADEASQNNPGFDWGQDARLIRLIVSRIQN